MINLRVGQSVGYVVKDTHRDNACEGCVVSMDEDMICVTNGNPDIALGCAWWTRFTFVPRSDVYKTIQEAYKASGGQ